MRRLVRAYPSQALAWGASTVGFAAYGWMNERPSTTLYVVQVIAAVLVFAWAARTTAFSGTVVWILVVWSAAHLAGGLVPVEDGVLYNSRPVRFLPQFDQVVHAVGFGAAAALVGEALRERMAPGVALGVIAALAGMGIGAINEVLEFAATRVLPETNVGGYANTGWDLVANLVGAVAAGVWTGVGARRSRAPGPSPRPPDAAAAR